MSSKRRQHPYGEAVSQGRCCTNGTCSRVGQPSFVNLLQDDVLPPSCKGSRRKTEGRQESGTDVGSAATAQHTHTHINTHAQGTEHHGEDNYERPTETGNFSTALNNVIKQDNMEGAALGTRMTDDGEEGEVRGKNRQQRKGKTSPSSGCAEVVRSREHVWTS
jgi:hypothetical protein